MLKNVTRPIGLALLVAVTAMVVDGLRHLAAAPRARSPESHSVSNVPYVNPIGLVTATPTPRVFFDDPWQPPPAPPEGEGNDEEPRAPTPIPLATPAEQRCEYYQIDFLHVNGDRRSSSRRRSVVSMDYSHIAGLSCLGDLIDQTNDQIAWAYKKRMRHEDQVLYQYFRGRGRGHLYGKIFTEYFWANIKQRSGFRVAGTGATDEEIRADNELAKSMMNCFGGEVLPGHGYSQIGGASGNRLKDDGCRSGSLFFDENCNLVDKALVDENNRCGTIAYYAELATPISLVWSEDYADKPATMVNFKLNPHSEDSVWMWRASEALPLLVYDPEHTGSITSATQLFGNWTFGGKERPALSGSHTVGNPWGDGYEALSVMDKNHDDKVSGEELQDLALWFDRNQDGVSQPGEVVALSELDVLALFYRADAEEEGALVATKGYERRVDGKIVVARSMDWSEKSLRDGFDVIREKTGTSLSDSLTASESSTATAANVSDRSSAEAIEGVWNFSLNHPAKGSGLLSFTATEDGILGTTVSQVGVAGVPKVASNVLFAHFQGEAKRSENGSIEIHFTQGESQGTTLISSATLSKEQDRLVGKTTVRNSPLSKSGSYEYTWTAERRVGTEQ